jgi:hypothetical protein
MSMREGPADVIRRGVAGAVLSVVMAGGALVGCDDSSADDPPDSGLPSESKTSESSPTPSQPTETGPTPPALPAAASQPGRAGAKAFVRFYLSLLNYAKHTGDTAPVKQYSRPGCETCASYVEIYEGLYDRGGLIKGGDFSIKSYRKVVPTVPEDMYVGFFLMQGAGQEREHRGAPLEQRGVDGPHNVQVYLVRTEKAWLMSRWGFLS